MKLFNIGLGRLNKMSAWLIYLCFFACLLPIAIFAYKRPAYNWDMLAYMALVVQMEKSDITDVHKITYDNARRNIPPKEYDKLIGGELRKSRMENPSEFRKILPLYAAKPFYIWLSYGFYKAGVSLPLSTVMPSIIAYLIIGLLLFHWLSRHHLLVLAFAEALLIMYSSLMINVANLSTPDCVSALFLLTASYFILERPSVLLSFLFLAGSVFVRLDNIILSILLLAFLFFSRLWKKKIPLVQYLIMLAALAGSYMTVSGIARGDNWSLLYYPTFIKYYQPNHEPQLSFSMSNYLALFSDRVVMALLYSQVSIFFLLVLIMFSAALPAKLRDLPFELLFCILLVFTIIARFILFPDLEDRFYIAFYVVILILFIRQFSSGRNFLKVPGLM